jgi:acrylyl-CoA reductase (NADPH)
VAEVPGEVRAFVAEQRDGEVDRGLRTLPSDELGDGDVVIRVACSSVNYKDALATIPKGQVARISPLVPGIDLAGTVVAGGDEGAEVLVHGYDLGVAHHGGYAEYARVPSDWVVPLPDRLSARQAMALGTAGFTAAMSVARLERHGLSPDSGPVLVTGATGGVGSIAIAMLAKLGYHVVALTGKESESEWLKKLGAKEVLLRQSLNLAKIKPLDKATWAGAVDNLGGPVLAWIASTMKDNGTIASVGLAQSAELHTWVMPFILRGASLLGINSGDSSNDIRESVWRRLATDLKPPLLKEMARTIPFAQLPSVFDDFINAKVNRRVVVDLSE